jgi:hypothetical protein
MSRQTALSAPQPSLGGPLLALQQRLAHEFAQPKLLQQSMLAKGVAQPYLQFGQS